MCYTNQDVKAKFLANPLANKPTNEFQKVPIPLNISILPSSRNNPVLVIPCNNSLVLVIPLNNNQLLVIARNNSPVLVIPLNNNPLLYISHNILVLVIPHNNKLVLVIPHNNNLVLGILPLNNNIQDIHLPTLEQKMPHLLPTVPMTTTNNQLSIQMLKKC